MTRIALVTGASRGLCSNPALHFARRGDDVIVTYQTREVDAQAAVAERREWRIFAVSAKKSATFQDRYGFLPI